MSKVNGYSNQETYDVVLWCKNDEGLYREMQDRPAVDIEAFFTDLRDLLVSSPERLTEQCRSMLVDIGSLWRVEWSEVEEALKGD